jgi:hypothetical protein
MLKNGDEVVNQSFVIAKTFKILLVSSHSN